MIPDNGPKNYNFSRNWNLRNSCNWIEYLQDWVKSYNNKPINCLEIGVDEGRSGCWMLDNVLTHPESTYLGIDIEIKKHAKQNFSRHGDKVKLIESDSRFALRKLEPHSFNVVYIDGHYLKENVLFDAVLAWDLSNDLIIWSDYNNRHAKRFGIDQAINCVLKNIPPKKYKIIFENIGELCIQKNTGQQFNIQKNKLFL